MTAVSKAAVQKCSAIPFVVKRYFPVSAIQLFLVPGEKKKISSILFSNQQHCDLTEK